MYYINFILYIPYTFSLNASSDFRVLAFVNTSLRKISD